jgi:hypothetical protein
MAQRNDNAIPTLIGGIGSRPLPQAVALDLPGEQVGRLLRMAGTLGLLGAPASILLLVAGAAAGPSSYVPASRAGFPSWLSGPLHGLGQNLGASLGATRFQVLALALTGSYLLVLLGARVLPANTVYLSIVTVHLLLLAGPVLFSSDLFGYLGYARLGALHGLDPYTHTLSAFPPDAVYRFLGWQAVSSPYGPLFTLSSYALAPLGLAGGVWALKALAVAASLGAVALVARAAGRDDGEADGARWPPHAAAAFLGLNPILLAFAVGGAHNDCLILLLLAAALALSATPGQRLRARDGAAVDTGPRLRAAVWTLGAAAGIKLSAGLALPFLVCSPRRGRDRFRLALWALLALATVAALGVLGFGSHALGFLTAVGGEQALVAVHSVPAELARAVGLDGTPAWWRGCFAALFALICAYALWRTAHGWDWRVAGGWAMLALLLCSAWLLPWYAIWPLPFAAVTADRRLRGGALVLCAYALLIRLGLAGSLLDP